MRLVYSAKYRVDIGNARFARRSTGSCSSTCARPAGSIAPVSLSDGRRLDDLARVHGRVYLDKLRRGH